MTTHICSAEVVGNQPVTADSATLGRDRRHRAVFRYGVPFGIIIAKFAHGRFDEEMQIAKSGPVRV